VAEVAEHVSEAIVLVGSAMRAEQKHHLIAWATVDHGGKLRALVEGPGGRLAQALGLLLLALADAILEHAVGRAAAPVADNPNVLMAELRQIFAARPGEARQRHKAQGERVVGMMLPVQRDLILCPWQVAVAVVLGAV